MKKVTTFLLALLTIAAFGQDYSNSTGYHRSSLYVMPVVHMQDSFANEILYSAQNLPFPDRYNNLNETGVVDVVQLDDHSNHRTVRDTTMHRVFDKALNESELAKMIVAHWFMFDTLRGFSTERLVTEGMYDASELQKELAAGTLAGMINLVDAGNELVSKSFVLINDMSYINHADRAQTVSDICTVIADYGKEAQKVGNELQQTNTGIGLLDGVLGLAGAASSLAGSVAELAGDLTKSTNELLEIKGFAVLEATYLYQLDWSPAVQNKFYSKYYTENGDASKIEAFLNDKSTFRLKYVGMMPTVTNNATAFNAGTYSKMQQADQILITCARTMDDAINNLQAKFEDFRVYTPIMQILYDAKGKVTGFMAAIGQKEGVTLKKKYAVREMVFQNGKTTYRDVMPPLKADQIWDNRHGVEQDMNAMRGTTFKTKNGKLYPGLLLIEK